MNAFSGGICTTTVIYPETMTLLVGSIAYKLDENNTPIYQWHSATVQEPHNRASQRLANMADLAQIARFLDNGKPFSIHRTGGAFSQLKSYVYLAAWIHGQAPAELGLAA